MKLLDRYIIRQFPSQFSIERTVCEGCLRTYLIDLGFCLADECTVLKDKCQL